MLKQFLEQRDREFEKIFPSLILLFRGKDEGLPIALKEIKYIHRQTSILLLEKIGEMCDGMTDEHDMEKGGCDCTPRGVLYDLQSSLKEEISNIKG